MLLAHSFAFRIGAPHVNLPHRSADVSRVAQCLFCLLRIRRDRLRGPVGAHLCASSCTAQAHYTLSTHARCTRMLPRGTVVLMRLRFTCYLRTVLALTATKWLGHHPPPCRPDPVGDRRAAPHSLANASAREAPLVGYRCSAALVQQATRLDAGTSERRPAEAPRRPDMGHQHVLQGSMSRSVISPVAMATSACF